MSSTLDIVKDIFEKARNNPAFPDMSEQTTCDQVILPLMIEAGGYDRCDCTAQVQAPGTGTIDYIFHIKDKQPAILLEAEAWRQPLKDDFAQQVLNYANTNGISWAILTNGQEWRLYDQRINGKAVDKQVFTAKRHDEIAEFLDAVSKRLVEQGCIDSVIEKVRLRRWLDDSLRKPDSDLIKRLVKICRQAGFSRATNKELSELLALSSEVVPGAAKPEVENDGSKRDDGIVPPSGATGRLATIKEWVAQATNKKPSCLKQGTETVSKGPHWASLLQDAIRWLNEARRLPPPPLKLSKRYLYASKSEHPNGKPFVATSTSPMETEHGPIYIEYNWSAENVCHCLCVLFSEAGYDLGTIVIEFS